jgi:hypothetical protein
MRRLSTYSVAAFVELALCVCNGTAADLKDTDKVTTLEVRIETADELFAGQGDLPFVNLPVPKSSDAKSNNTYLDLGFLSFPLGNEFRSGQTKSIIIKLNNYPPFTVGDITMVGLRKHGLFDLNNAPDSLVDGLLKGGLTPEVFSARLKDDLQKAHDVAGLAQKALELEEKTWQAQQGVIRNADQAVSEAKKHLESINYKDLDNARKAAKTTADYLNSIPREIEETQ